MSPIDPIPDFIPILGYVDDMVFVPVGVFLARHGIPDDAMADARAEAGNRMEGDGVVGWAIAAVILLCWVAVGLRLRYAVVRFGRHPNAFLPNPPYRNA
ncbi:YkvA family protein (plasmid) [Haladaptatus sp. SPP-AMP-3]|uniref:YkvA family protein n=1 Tax=Haladaptatus sp. SPP-AMP-3 TaxID=3121295 RepID=UPI003C2D4494